MGNIFNLDNPFFNFMSKISDLIILNLLWIITSIPIITIGASTTALYSIIFKILDNTDEYIISTYFKSFKENFKRSTLGWILIILIGYILFLDLSYWFSLKSYLSCIPIVLTLIILIIFLNSCFCFFALQSRFDNTFKNTLKNSIIISIRHFFSSISIILLSIGFILINLKFPFAIFLTLILGASGFAYISSYIFLCLFKKYEIN